MSKNIHLTKQGLHWKPGNAFFLSCRFTVPRARQRVANDSQPFPSGFGQRKIQTPAVQGESAHGCPGELHQPLNTSTTLLPFLLKPVFQCLPNILSAGHPQKAAWCSTSTSVVSISYILSLRDSSQLPNDHVSLKFGSAPSSKDGQPAEDGMLSTSTNSLKCATRRRFLQCCPVWTPTLFFSRNQDYTSRTRPIAATASQKQIYKLGCHTWPNPAQNWKSSPAGLSRICYTWFQVVAHLSSSLTVHPWRNMNSCRSPIFFRAFWGFEKPNEWILLVDATPAASCLCCKTYCKNSKRPRFLQGSSPEQGIWRQGFGHQPCSKISAHFVHSKGTVDAPPRFMNPCVGCFLAVQPCSSKL